ncbi:hypothetical protein BGW41_002364 [Actinomortierella wolfii]|nr:hypothetical protein BGW41_002364 [Actinomortierella wolfii]
MAATSLSTSTYSAEALLNRARRLSSASYEKNHPQPPSPTRFPEGEEPERSSPGIMANSNSSHPFLSSSSLSRPLSAGRRRSSFGRTHLPPSFYTHANRSDSSADSDRFLDPHRARSSGCTTSVSLALSLSSNASSTTSTPAPSSPSLSPTTTSSPPSSSPTRATAEGLPASSTASAVTTRRSWSVSSRPRALTLESIKETDLLAVESADNTLAALQAARRDVHRKHKSENGQGTILVSDILQVLRQGSDVDLTQTIGLQADNNGTNSTEEKGSENNLAADNGTSKEANAITTGDAGSSSSSSLVSLTVTLAPCSGADGADEDGAKHTQKTLSIHITDNEDRGGDVVGSANADSQPAYHKKDQETSDTVMQTLSKAEAEHKKEQACLDGEKLLPSLPDHGHQDINNHHRSVDATNCAVSSSDVPSAPKTVALNANNGTQNLLTVPDTTSSPTDNIEDEQDDVVAPLTTVPTSPSSTTSSNSFKSKDSTASGLTSSKSVKLSKRSSRLFGKLVPKFLHTSFTPSGPPGQGVALTPSPSSAPSIISTSSGSKSPDRDHKDKAFFLPPLPTISQGIEKDLGSVLQQHTAEHGESKDSERSLLDEGRKTSRRSSLSSVLSRTSSNAAPASTPTSSAGTTMSNSSAIAVTFDEGDSATSTADGDNDVADNSDIDKEDHSPKKETGDNDDTEFWSSILRKSGADAAAAEDATTDATEDTTTTTAKPSSLATRLATYPSSTSLSSVNSLSSPVCYLTESPITSYAGRMESDDIDDHRRASTLPAMDSNAQTDNNMLRHAASSSSSGVLGHDERRVRLRNAVAEWRRAASTTDY